jgi:hypothetical protein
MMWTPKRFFSPEQVEAAMTARGGFSRQSLAKMGVPFPPPKGWRKAITERPVTCKEIVRRGRKWGATMPVYNSPYDNPSQRTPEEWYALIPKLAHWAFKEK